MKKLLFLLPLLMCSCNTYKQSIEYVVQDMVEVDVRVYNFMEDVKKDFEIYSTRFDFTNTDVVEVLILFKQDYNKLVKSFAKDILKGEKVSYSKYQIGIERLMKVQQILNSKIPTLSKPTEYNDLVFGLVELFLKEVGKSFLLKEYSEIFLEKFLI